MDDENINDKCNCHQDNISTINTKHSNTTNVVSMNVIQPNIYIKVMLVVTVEVPQWDQRAIILRAHSHLALGNSVTASDAKKMGRIPILSDFR